MRILHVIAPADYGGAESVVRALATGHRRAGHDVRVVAILDPDRRGTNPFVKQLENAGVAVIALSPPRRRYDRERREFGRVCRDVAPDIVHVHGSRAVLLDGPVAQSLGVPVVSTVHGMTGGDLRNRLYEALQRWSLRRCDGVVAVSRPIADLMALGGIKPERLFLLQNAWEPDGGDVSAEEARRVLGSPPGKFHIGWVGRFTQEKGADVLLAALARLDDVPWIATMVGDGPERPTIAARSEELEIADRLSLPGAVPDAGRLHRAFDVFVLSSRTEGTPIVLFEAIAAGVPVVATRVGGVPDVVTQQEAFLVAPEDPAALADAIRSVHSEHSDAQRRAAAAATRLERNYRIGPWLDQYEDVYRRMLAPKL